MIRYQGWGVRNLSNIKGGQMPKLRDREFNQIGRVGDFSLNYRSSRILAKIGPKWAMAEVKGEV